jgi:hypothetical protein
MAIVQISQIQIRRGLQQDLPQLASAEMGWSLDTRRLFIGNGTTDEGAPTEGVTEILTQYSDFLSTIPNYVFSGTDSGYTSQTGPNQLTPVTRTLQSVLDDIVTVRDFGTVGNGIADDTAALNRAIQQIYKSTLNGVYAAVQRLIKIPAGTYVVSGPIVVPPNCTLIGDGKNNTVIVSSSNTVLMTGDASFQTGALINSTGALFPANIFISGIKFVKNSGTTSVIEIDSTTNIVFDNVYIKGSNATTNLVTTAGSVGTTTAVTFNNCIFENGVNGYQSVSNTNGVRIKNSTFTNNSGAGIVYNDHVNGLVSENNYFNSSVTTPLAGITGNNFSYGDYVANSNTNSGIYAGSAKFGTGETIALTTGTTIVRILDGSAGTIDYQLVTNSGNTRFGTLKYNTSNDVTYFDDDFTEPGVSLSANLYANSTGYLSCTVSSSTTLKYNIKQFV